MVYDYLVDFYFRTKEQATMQQVAKPQGCMVVNVPDNPEILQAMQQVEDDMTCMRVLLNDCKKYISEEEYQKRSTSIEKCHGYHANRSGKDADVEAANRTSQILKETLLKQGSLIAA